MNSCSPVLLIAILGLAIPDVAAQSPRPLREAVSPNKRFCLRVRPGRPGTDAVRGCKATLYERNREGRRERPRWARFLVNDVAPAQVFIRDDGSCVVTLDEHRVGGARHAMAIYGDRGQLLRHFLLPDLLKSEDWQHVRVEKQSLEWLGGAKCEFVDQPAQFVITLKHGREIRIDLRTLQVVRPQSAEADAAGIPSEFLALLFGEEPAAAATEPATQPADAADERAVAETRREDSVAEEGPVELAADAPAADRPATEELPADELAAASAGIPVPTPDPGDPVDYIAWANQMTSRSGTDAAPDYEAAIDLFTPWDGDRALLRAAAAGDREALAAPEVQEWVAANREALAYFSSGSELDYYSRELYSENGSMISVLLPDLQPLRQLGRAVLITGRQSEATGEPWLAADDYLHALAAGGHAGNGPTLIENLVGVAMQTAATNALLDLQAAPEAVDLDYAQLAARLQEAARPPRPLTEALQFERAMFMDTVQSMFAYDERTGAYELNDDHAGQIFMMLTSPTEDPGESFDEIERLRDIGFAPTVDEGNGFYDAVTAALSRPYPEARAQLREIEGRFESQDVNPMLRSLAPSFIRCHFLRTRAEAQRRATQLIANLQAHHQQFGVYPDSLDAFAGDDFVVDPFTGNGFRYQRSGPSFTLYSAGGNAVDDGGRPGEQEDEGDYVFWPRRQ